jgi:hypothetical protein
MGMGGKGHAPAALAPRKSRYPLYKRMSGPQGRSGRLRKTSPHQRSISGPSSPYGVAIPTELSYPTMGSVTKTKLPTFRQKIPKLYLLQGRILLICFLSKYLNLHIRVSIQLRVFWGSLSYADVQVKNIIVINIDA